jgi:hypothetical protein
MNRVEDQPVPLGRSLDDLLRWGRQRGLPAPTGRSMSSMRSSQVAGGHAR